MSVDDFELLKTVGKGSFGKVMQVRKKDSGKICALILVCLFVCLCVVGFLCSHITRRKNTAVAISHFQRLGMFVMVTVNRIHPTLIIDVDTLNCAALSSSTIHPKNGWKV